MTWYIISYELQRKGYSLNMIKLLPSLVNLDLLKIKTTWILQAIMASIVALTSLEGLGQDVAIKSHTLMYYNHLAI